MPRAKSSSLFTAWGDQVKGSWWKAGLMFLLYFVMRFYLEGLNVERGMAKAPSDLQSSMAYVDYISYDQAFYLFQASLLLIFLLLASYVCDFKFFNFKDFKEKRLAFVGRFFLGVYILQVLFNAIVAFYFPDYTGPENQVAVVTLLKKLHPLIGFLVIVIITPMTEEILFRGLIMKYIFPNQAILGAFVSTLLFVFMHGPSHWIDFISYFILASALTYLYLRTRSLEDAILFHILQNLISFIGLSLLK